jgi:hypothetical protein
MARQRLVNNIILPIQILCFFLDSTLRILPNQKQYRYNTHFPVLGDIFSPMR